MAFKLKPLPPWYNTESMNVSIHYVPEEDGVLGRANMNGTITINSNVKDLNQINNIIKHEMVHIKQMKDGRLAYDDNNIYHRKSGKGKWKVKKRSNKVDGSPSSWWEREAYNKK